MHRWSWSLALALFLVVGANHAQATDVPGGPVSGTWDLAGSPYNIQGDITVSAASSLVVEPGVAVVFQGSYGLTVFGTLAAVGTAASPVTFSGIVTWQGIRFENETEVSTLEHCEISGAEVGVDSIHSPLDIRDCHLHDHTTAVEVFGIGDPNPATVNITRTVIEDCQRHGIFIVENSNTAIDSCEVTGCALDGSPRGAIQLSNQSPGGHNDPTITDNWIHHNTWQGLVGFDVTGGGNIAPHVEGNVIEYNYTGVYLLYANGTLHDNQINHNFQGTNPNSGAGVMVAGSTARPTLTGNTLTGNFTAFYVIDGAAPNLGDLQNGDPTDDGGNEMYANVDPNGDTWSVYSNSTADIRAENNTWDSDDYGVIATTIFDGNDNPAYGIVDFDPIASGTGIWTAETGSGAPPGARLLGNQPNPSRRQTSIRFELDGGAAAARVRLEIFDVSGRWVRTVVDGHLAPGAHAIAWDGRDGRGAVVPAGVYYTRLATNAGSVTRSLVVLR